MHSHFSDSERDQLNIGIRRMIRLQGLIHDPNPIVWHKWLADENDIKEAIDVVASSFKRTASMIGKQKYHSSAYDPLRQVREDVLSYLTTNGAGPSATLQKRNLPVYYTVVVPLIESFSKLSHQEMLDRADDICAYAKDLIDQCTDYGTYDDALIAQQQIRDTIRLYEERAQEERDKKKRKRKVKDPLLELLATYGSRATEEWEGTNEEELF